MTENGDWAVCPECNGSNVISGFLTGGNSHTVFTVKGTEKRFLPEWYPVECKACKDCRAIFDLRILPKKKKDKE